MSIIRSIIGIPEQRKGEQTPRDRGRPTRADSPTIIVDTEDFPGKLVQYATAALDYRLKYAYPVQVQVTHTQPDGDGEHIDQEHQSIEIFVPQERTVRRALDMVTYIHQVANEETSGPATFYIYQFTVKQRDYTATLETSFSVQVLINGPIIRVTFPAGVLLYGTPELGALVFMSPTNPIVRAVGTDELINVLEGDQATTYITQP